MKIKNYIILILIAILSFSCQKEEEEIINNNNTTQGNLTLSSSLTNLFSRVAQNPTSKDNVLDNTSCFSVQLPVTVVVNGTTLVVTDSNDFDEVEDIKELYNTDDDIVHFTYPITIKYRNYQSKTITSETQFNQILSTCPTDDGFNEIECANFNYPIILNTYNSSNQYANSVTINNDAAMVTFVANLQSNVFYAVNYPISVVNSSSQTITITNNSQLEDLIQEAIAVCSNTSSSTSFIDILTNGTWHVSYCEYDNLDKTSYYSLYNFTFYSNGTIHVVKNTINSYGTWSSYLDGGHTKLDLNFDDSSLHEIQEDWKLNEYTATEIRLKKGDSSNSDYLYFQKN